MSDPLESVIAVAMNNGNDIQPFEVAEAIRNSPAAIASLKDDWPTRVDDYLTKIHETTTFGVNLKVRVHDEAMKTTGSPIDWDWDGMVKKWVGDDAHTDVVVQSVAIESKSYVDDDGELILETTYSVEDNVPDLLADSANKILGYAQDHIADNHHKYGGSIEEFQEDLIRLSSVTDFLRKQLNNPELGDNGINEFVSASSKLNGDTMVPWME